MKDKLVNCFFQSSILITSTPWIMEQYLISRFHKFYNVHVEFIFQWEAYLHWWGKELLPRDQSELFLYWNFVVMFLSYVFKEAYIGYNNIHVSCNFV